MFISEENGKTKDENDADDSKDDPDENVNGKALGEIAAIEKFITQTKIDGLQTLYTVRIEYIIQHEYNKS